MNSFVRPLRAINLESVLASCGWLKLISPDHIEEFFSRFLVCSFKPDAESTDTSKHFRNFERGTRPNRTNINQGFLTQCCFTLNFCAQSFRALCPRSRFSITNFFHGCKCNASTIADQSFSIKIKVLLHCQFFYFQLSYVRYGRFLALPSRREQLERLTHSA